jgi:hypothetical protein
MSNDSSSTCSQAIVSFPVNLLCPSPPRPPQFIYPIDDLSSALTSGTTKIFSKNYVTIEPYFCIYIGKYTGELIGLKTI